MARTRISWSLVLIGVFCGTVRGQDPVPLEDTRGESLMPPGISRADARLSGKLAYIWKEADGSGVLHAIGGFSLRLGSRRLRAREAVVWLAPNEVDGNSFTALEIFLWQDARVVDPGGSVTTAPALFVTAATFGKVLLAVDRKSFQSHDQSLVYQDASAVRSDYAAGQLGLPPPVDRGGWRWTEPAPRRKPIYVRANLKQELIQDELVATAVGGVYFAQGTAQDADFLEIRADSAVIFSYGPDREAGPDSQAPPLSGDRAAGFNLEAVQGIYLEGDVRLQQHNRFVRASRVYYDLARSRALILDAVLRLDLADRGIPLYVRAASARQLSQSQFSATAARVSISEFYTPHYHLGAEQLELTIAEAPSDLEGVRGARAGRYTAHNVTFNLDGLPLLYWPFTSGSFEEGESALHSVRIGTDDDFGFSLETRFNLFTLLGMEKPRGFRRAMFDVDYYTKRGVGAGVEADYAFDPSFGLFRGYYIYDLEDNDNIGPFRRDDIDHPNRGRATWRHRHFLPEGWELTLEGSYISDENFLEEYFEREFDTDKDQETAFRLKKQGDDWAFQIDTQVRILNWLTQTERLPDLSFRLIGRPLGPTTIYSENRAGLVRYRPDERRFFISARNNFFDNRVRSGAVLRADSRQELDWPLLIGPLKIVPFAVGRVSAWDDTPHRGGLERIYGMFGVRGSTYLSRVFESVASELWALDGLRHIVKLDFTGWIAADNRSSRDLFPFDAGIEEIDDFSGATFGIRQRWQTKRGPSDRQRVVDWITLGLEAGFFSRAQGDEWTNGYGSWSRPEESVTSNYVSGDFQWRISGSTALLADASFDVDDGDLDIANISWAVERSPRFSYFAGWRMIDETDSNLFGFGGNYRMSEKHTVAMRTYFDIDRGSTELVDLSYIRKFPRWYASFTFSLDEIEDNISVSMTIWPEGFPSVAIGPKRYTGLAETTAIRP